MTVPLLRVSAPWPYAVWLGDLDATLSPDAAATLSDDERARASRFAFDTDRRRYLSAHAMLRAVLGRCTGTPAAALRFEHGANGKPFLGALRGGFNMSHSDGAMAVVWTDAGCSRDVGIDIEQRRRIPEMDSLVDEHFTVLEREAFAGTARNYRTDAFLRGWTRKEAVLKALGTGFSLPAQSVDAGLEAHARTVWVECADREVAVEVESLSVPGPWCCAVARIVAEHPTAVPTEMLSDRAQSAVGMALRATIE